MSFRKLLLSESQLADSPDLNDLDQNFGAATADAFVPPPPVSHPASTHPGSGLSEPIAISDGGGPEADAAKGKGGGGTTSGGGSSGGGTSGGGSTGGTTSGITAGTTIVPVTTVWQGFNPPTGVSTTPTDAYFYKEWNLTSTAAGLDLAKAWQNYTGLGVKIGVIDDGIDYTHSDLNPNYLFNLDYDATNGGTDAFGTSTDSHGTTVAGVIDAALNGTGVVGVAFNAGLAGFRISYSTGGPSQLADAFNHVQMNGMDVANASWGYTTAYQDNFFSSSFSSSKAAILNDVMHGRGGLGTNIVFAAGNGAASGDNVNYHNYQNDPYVITVAGTDPYGHVAQYSTPGAALLVSAPSSVMTDDRVGSAGYSSGDYIAMGGTSFSAPEVSGVIALMLQANPNLGFLDVQEILAYSAKETDPTNPSWHVNGATDWNGGGMHFSENYGFGLVDATAAVRLAESWQYQTTFADMSTEAATHTDNAAIPDGTGSVKSQITLASSLDVDKVVVDLNITHSQVSDLTVTLTSPDGTMATLASHPASGTGSGIVFETSANNFWGEDAQGTWTLTVTDSVTGNVGTLNSWALEAIGVAPTTPTTYVYTDEFGTLLSSANSALTDSSGTASINTAAVTSGSYLDLHAGALDTIAGKTLQIGLNTSIKSVWAGDGNDTIIANDAGDTIQGGRGNDTIVAGKGADTLSGGPGNDTFVFNFLKTAPDTINDFKAGQDVIDLHQLFASIGYTGADPVVDRWLALASDSSGGTDFVVDPHNGQAAQTIVDVLGVAPTILQEGVDYLTQPKVA